MPRILINNAHVVTLDDENTVYPVTTIAIEDGRILSIDSIPDAFVADEIIDVGGNIVMPGLINSHTHAAMTFARGYAEDLPLDRWFNERIWRLESALTPDIVYWGTLLAIAEMIRGGVVAFADHYFHMDKVIQAVAESGVRANVAWAVFGDPDGEVGITIPETVAFVKRYDGSMQGRLRAMFGPHSPYQCPDAFLARTAAVAVREDIGIHIHASETAAQVSASQQTYDMSPIELLAHRGLFETETLVAHAIHVNEVDIAVLASKSVNVVQCPSTHMKYGMGVTPVTDMQEAGVNVALGTDGAGSSTRIDMWREMRLSVLTQRQALGDATVLPDCAPLKMASRSGAVALGFPGSGVLQPGSAADLIIIDMDAPHFLPLYDAVSALVWCTQPADVTSVMVDGKWLMRDRQLLTIDLAQVREGFLLALDRMIKVPQEQARRYAL